MLNSATRVRVSIALATACLVVGAPSARADILNFSYADPEQGFTFKGTFEGVLLDDKNTFVIQKADYFGYSVDPKQYPKVGETGSSSWDISTVVGGDYLWFGQFLGKNIGNPLGTVTLNGSYMDFAACTDPKCQENGFSMLAGNQLIGNINAIDGNFKDGVPLITASMLGDRPTFFNQDYWKTDIILQDGNSFDPGLWQKEQEELELEKEMLAEELKAKDGSGDDSNDRGSTDASNGGSDGSGSPTAVPEPSTWLILATGTLAAALARRKGRCHTA